MDVFGRCLGLPGGTRTPDPQLRRLVLYPVELRAAGPARLVGAAGFELATYWSQTSCATRLRYAPNERLYEAGPRRRKVGRRGIGISAWTSLRVVKLLRRIARGVLKRSPLRALRRRLFLRSSAAVPAQTVRGAPKRVLVVGVYLASREHSAEHLARAFAQVHAGIDVVQRWVAIGAASTSAELGSVTVLQVASPAPKFVLVNRVLADIDIGGFDYVLVVDDDIHLPRHFLPSFLAYQDAFDFALAQPARAWHSHFDHAIAMRRPWLLARRTRFVECGPLVSFRRDAAALLLPFAHPQQLWGLDFVWPVALERRSLKMGIIDAVAVDHSLRPQAAAYDKSRHDAAMHRFLAGTPHLPMAEAFTVIDRYRSLP